jgi:hypothetical protein
MDLPFAHPLRTCVKGRYASREWLSWHQVWADLCL